MALLQHHFELAGWNEITIVIRFWIIAGCASRSVWPSSMPSGSPAHIPAAPRLAARRWHPRPIWPGRPLRTVRVAGIGLGSAAADTPSAWALVTVVDQRDGPPSGRATVLEILGGRCSASGADHARPGRSRRHVTRLESTRAAAAPPRWRAS
jgi:hypothetical protein